MQISLPNYNKIVTLLNKEVFAQYDKNRKRRRTEKAVVVNKQQVFKEPLRISADNCF